MNINDIKSEVIPTDFSEYDRLDLIFARQHALVSQYVEIEKKNGLLHTPDVPVNIDDRFGQARLKDFFWRVTEEITEAADAEDVHGHIPDHTLEELSDALHFLVEAFILAGFEPKDLDPGTAPGEDKLVAWMNIPVTRNGPLKYMVYYVIHHLGCASNCLKQRPWKNTHQLTDTVKFREHMIKSFAALMETFQTVGLNAHEVFRLYWLKSEVNKFRIRSNY